VVIRARPDHLFIKPVDLRHMAGFYADQNSVRLPVSNVLSTAK